MTEKIYYDNSLMYDFCAEVIDIIQKDGIYQTVLDKTCFFPEGGGQPCDTGKIGDAVIMSVFENDGIIYHCSDKKPDYNIGDEVKCSVCKEKRFARMQAHSGEHLVSGLICGKYGFENVGFHMDDTLMTVDFNGYLTKEQLFEIEREANYVIYKNVPIKSYVINGEECKTEYRSKLAELKNPRLVEIVDYDICACCAPHVTSTGEIGIIKILSSASHRGGVRITLICGITAYNELAARYNDILSLSDMLCAPHNSVPAAVRSLLDKTDELKREIALRKETAVNNLVDSFSRTDGNICSFSDGLGVEEIRKAAVLLREKCGGICVLCTGNDENGYAYAITSKNGGLRSFSADINNALCGRGGGKDEMLQGRFSASRSDIEKYFSERKFVL